MELLQTAGPSRRAAAEPASRWIDPFAAAIGTVAAPVAVDVPASAGVGASLGATASAVAATTAGADALPLWPALPSLSEVGGGAGQRAQFGNKAWRLARLARAGLPVPAGFCIAAEAFDDGGTVCPDELSAALIGAIIAAYRRLGAPLVAVRSSAADEDLAEQSGAGVYTTVLNVSGEEALLAAVIRCRAARHGRPGASIGEAAPAALAVLVQRQVEADAAGVLFTADPLSGQADRIVINVVPGLGEPLASGRVNGDTFHLSPSGDLLRQKVRRKETMLTASGEGPVPAGRRQRPTLTAPELRRLAGMAAEVGKHFAAHGEPAEQGGAAIDIEFAMTGGWPILLQARHIPSRLLAGRGRTVGGDVGGIKVAATPADAGGLDAYLQRERQALLAHADALRASGRVVGGDVVWSAGNIGELLPTPSRFSFALFRHIFAGRDGAIVGGRRRLGYRLGPEAGEDLFVLIAGQPYFNLEIDAATYDVGVALPVAALLAEVTARPEAASYPELGLYPRTLAAAPGGAEAAAAFRQRMLRHAATQRRRFAALLGWLEKQEQREQQQREQRQRDERERGQLREQPWEQQREQEQEQQQQEQRQQNQQASSASLAQGAECVAGLGVEGAEFATLQAEIASELNQLRQIGLRFVIAARLGFYFADLLRRRLQKICPNAAAAERRYARLLQGLDGSRITGQTHDLEALAEGELEAATFLARHGHLASNELELAMPRLAEQPERLDVMLAELRAGGRSPRREFARQQAQRRRCEAALRRQLAGQPDECAELFAELAAAQHYLPLRETLKFHLAIHYARLREHLLALAKKLHWPADSLLQLEPAEVLALVADSYDSADRADRADRAGRDTVPALIGQRRAERQLARRLAGQSPLPTVLFASRPQLVGQAANVAPAGGEGREGRDGDSFAAEPIAPGHAEGIVRLIRLDDEAPDSHPAIRLAEFSGHEIIVAPSANLGLAPLFRSAAGVVVEVGGVLAHSACQAREAGIPALVLAGATRLLQDGDRIRLDAEHGRITVLARAAGHRPEWS